METRRRAGRGALLGHLRELILTGLGQGISAVQALVQVKLLTVILPVAEYGNWTLVLSLVSLVQMLPFSAFDQAVNRLHAENQRATKAPPFLPAALTNYVGIFAIWVVVWVIATVPTGSTFSLDQVNPAYFLFFAFTETLSATLIGIENIDRRRGRVVVLSLWKLIFRGALLTYLLVSDTHVSLNTILILFAVGNCVVLASGWGRIWPSCKQLRLRYAARVLGQLTKFSWPLVTWALFGWLQTTANRWYLAAFTDTTTVALYAILITASFYIPNFIYTLAASFVTPFIYAKSGVIQPRLYFGLLGSLFAVLAVYAALMIPFAELLVLAISTRDYLPVVPYVLPLTITAVLQVVGSMSTVVFYHAKATRKLLLVNTLPGALSVVAGFFLVQTLGLGGAAIAYAMGQLAFAALAFWKSTAFVLRANREAKNRNEIS